MAQPDERARLRELLYAAIADEHRLHESAAREATAARRWAERARLAERKEAPDLAAAARQRAAQHERRAQLDRAEGARLQAHIADLKSTVLHAGVPPRRAVTADSGVLVERRLAALERDSRLNRDLAELKRQLGRA